MYWCFLNGAEKFEYPAGPASMRIRAQGRLKSASLPISPYGFECSIKQTHSPSVSLEILAVVWSLSGRAAGRGLNCHLSSWLFAPGCIGYTKYVIIFLIKCLNIQTIRAGRMTDWSEKNDAAECVGGR